MNEKLLQFHKKCKPEFIHLLKSFNILFYGYGCKRALLNEIFPNAKIFNCKFQKISNIVEELLLDGVCEEQHSTIKGIDEELFQRNKKLILICINFSFEMVELQNLKAINLIGTLESLDFKHDQDDIEAFNFIHRDLTTFENYSDEIIDIDLNSFKISTTMMVVNSVPERSRKVFKEFLILGNCNIEDVFSAVKKKLMISNKNNIIELFHEFVDHGIVKIQEGGDITLNFSKKDREGILENEDFKKI